VFAISAAIATPAIAQVRDPFEKGTVGIEFGVAPLVEIWNLNGHREPMLEGNAAFWGAIHDRVAIGIEFHHGYVFQHTPGALVQGISPLFRWKMADRPTWDWFRSRARRIVVRPVHAAARHKVQLPVPGRRGRDEADGSQPAFCACVPIPSPVE
jgi:hypothetical protein